MWRVVESRAVPDVENDWNRKKFLKTGVKDFGFYFPRVKPVVVSRFGDHARGGRATPKVGGLAHFIEYFVKLFRDRTI